MGKKNFDEKPEDKKETSSKIILNSHINILYQLGLITLETKEQLKELSESEDIVENTRDAVIIYITSLYEMILKSKKTQNQYLNIQLAKILLECLNEPLYNNDGQVALTILNKVYELLNIKLENKELFKNEILFNLNIILDSIKNNGVLAPEDINVIISMIETL